MWTVLLLYFLIYLIGDSHGELGFCKHEQPVIEICTHSELTMETIVYVDTIRVPTFQKTSCDCIISPSISGVTFSFSNDDESALMNMVFRIDGKNLNDAVLETVVSKLSVSTTSNFTNEGTCLNVSKGDNSTFNITCKANTETTTESGASSTLGRSKTATGQVPVTTQRTYQDEDKEENSFIIPVVASLSGLVCLVILILVIIYCRRRSSKTEETSRSSSPDARDGKEEDSDYYMSENPMYNVTETRPKEQTESEYHYIENDIHDGRISTNHYESAPGSPVRKQLKATDSDKELHYAYSTPFTTSQKCRPKEVNKETIVSTNNSRSLPNNKSTVGENMYDSTDKAVGKPFVGVNEYHHLTPTGSRKKAAVDIYNTVENSRDTSREQEEYEEDTDYHVTNPRR